MICKPFSSYWSLIPYKVWKYYTTLSILEVSKSLRMTLTINVSSMRVKHFKMPIIYIYIFKHSAKPYWLVAVFCLGGLIHHKPFQRHYAKPVTSAGKNLLTDDSHNIGCVGSLYNVPQRTYKHGRYLWDGKATVYHGPYPRRLESLTICGCNYKSSTFSSVILRPWVLVRPESNSRPPAWQPRAQPCNWATSATAIQPTAKIMVVFF